MRACFVILLLLLPVMLPAQEMPFIHYTTEDGLPSNRVYSQYHDSRGWLWLATDKGAVRYNGYHFETFTTFDGLPGNDVFFFEEDLRKRLWIGSYSGDLCYFRDGRFHTAANTPYLALPNKIYHSRYIRAEADSSATMFLESQSVLISIGAERVRVYSLKEARQRAGNNSLIYARKTAPDRFQLFYSNLYIVMDTSGHILQVQPYRHNSLYIYAPSGKKEYLYSTKGVYTLDEKLVYPIDSLPVEGLLVNPYYFDGKRLLRLQNGGLIIPGFRKMARGSNVTAVIQDKKGDYWVSTSNNGVFRFRNEQNGMKYYPQLYEGVVQHARCLDSILYFITGDNKAYAFSKGQIFRSAAIGQKLVPEPRRSPRWLISDSGDCFQSAGNVLYHAAWKNGHINTLHQLPHSYSPELKNLLFNGRSLFLVSALEVAVYDTGRQRLQQAALGRGFPQRLFSSDIDSRGQLWFSTIDNMYKVEGLRAIAQTRYSGPGLLSFRFCGGYLTGYTHDNQLLVCNTQSDSLPASIVGGQNCIWDKFYVLDDRHLLVSTNNYYRLLSFSPSAGKPKYTVQVIEDPFLPRQAEYVCSDGSTCYFFHGGNITSVPLEQLRRRPATPVVSFTGIRSRSGHQPAAKQMKFDYRDSRDISISFSGISPAGGALLYEYSVSGTGRDQWHSTSGSTINLLAPGSGTHLIKVRARTLSSNYSEPALLELTILPPFWASWWFALLVIGTAATLSWLLLRSIVRSVLRRRQEKHDLEMRFQQSEFKALNALMNPHFIFNSLNNIQGLINDNDKRKANRYLAIFSGLVRQNMHNVARAMIPLQQELTLIDHYLKLEQLRFKGMLHYDIRVADGVDPEEVLIPPLLVQPLVENAVRHGIWPMQSGEGHISLQVYEEGTTLCISITDNGVGIHHARPQSGLHESFGLYNLQQRAERLRHFHNRDLTLHLSETTRADGTVSGTCALLKIRENDRS